MTINAAYSSINQLMIGLVLQHSRSNRMKLSIFYCGKSEDTFTLKLLHGSVEYFHLKSLIIWSNNLEIQSDQRLTRPRQVIDLESFFSRQLKNLAFLSSYPK